MGELLSINQFIWHLFAFILFAWVLYKAAWKPILGMIDARSEKIESSFAEIEDKNAEVSRLQEEYEVKLREIQEETTHRIQEAIRRGEEIAAEIKSDAERQRDGIIDKARADIAREREIAASEIRNQVVDLTFQVSEKLLRDPTILNREAHRKLLDRYLTEVEEVK